MLTINKKKRSVNYGTYINDWSSLCRNRSDFIKAAGISYTDVEKEGIITPLTSLECKYKKAAFYEDQLQIHVNLTKLSPVRLEFSYKVTRGDDLIATGKTTHGMVTKDLKPINVKKEHPEIYRMFENALD